MWRVALLVVVALGSTAHGSVFQDPDSGLRITIGGPNAKVCFVRPHALTDATACAGKDITRSETSLSPQHRMFALVDDGKLSYAVAGMWVPMPGDTPLSWRDVDELYRGALVEPESSGFSPVAN